MSDLRLVVNGRRYGGWKSVRVTRSIKAGVNSFDLEVNDQWGQEEPWPVAEEDACRVEIDGEKVVDGFVDRCRLSLARAATFSGRDAPAALVDCSALPERWSYRDITALDAAKKLAAPFGIEVRAQAGLVFPKMRKFTVEPGETAFVALGRAARSASVLVVSDGEGGLLLTQVGTVRATPLVEGENLKDGGADYNAMGRYRRYVALTQAAGTDRASGDETRLRAEATDEGVRRAERTLMIRPESGGSTESVRRRVDWEARVRAARGDSIFALVQGWRQPNGKLWDPNTIAPMRSPRLRVDGELLISQVEHSVGTDGEITRLSLVRPDAFTPDPGAVVEGAAAWKEAAGGAAP